MPARIPARRRRLPMWRPRHRRDRRIPIPVLTLGLVVGLYPLLIIALLTR